MSFTVLLLVNRWGNNGNSDTLFSRAPKSLKDADCSHEIKGHLLLGRKAMTNLAHFHALEKEMATHSSVLSWRIPGTGEPGGMLSLGSHRVGYD